ncbi:hypothetical protein [Janibacter cremeus]|uniref:Uncharacterized protein n=1 Tax=Janibacter cremeus TaxID=1285192 RepID=A0A852VU91_9MICO|nr:hypothetical protein [Janibacter cremeus]NYF98243.1 hypothetical protein [Janibacter cremeus]
MTDDQDPTGMSHLLAGLKESGPMPDDLNDRIRASLEQEQAAHKDEASTSSDDGDGTAFWSRMDSDGRGPKRRSSPTGRWVLGIAVAAVVALGVGGVFALGSDGPDQSAGGSDTSAPEGEGGDSASSSDESGSSSSSSDAPAQVPAFAITDTGTDYSRGNLPAKAAELEADPRGAPELEDPARLDGMDTAAAASDCLTRLGQPELLPIVIDVATFDGRDGLLLMAEEAPEGKVRAWAVTTGCEPIWDQPFPIPEE